MKHNKKFLLSNYRVWTALITPFINNEVDFKALKNLLQAQEVSDNGVLILGSTGEALSLSLQERKDILSFVCSLELRIPLMVGVGGIDLAALCEWIDFCEPFPISAYLLPVPYYSLPGDQGQLQWFSALLDRTHHPCMLYNHPGRMGASLSTYALHHLCHHPNLWAVKEARGDVKVLQHYKRMAPEIFYYSGNDALIEDYLMCGAHGVVSVASNAWPEVVRLIVQQTLDKAPIIERKAWQEVTQALSLTTNPIPIKALMYLKKLISSPSVRLPLSSKDLESTQPLKVADDFLTRHLQHYQEINRDRQML